VEQLIQERDYHDRRARYFRKKGPAWRKQRPPTTLEIATDHEGHAHMCRLLLGWIADGIFTEEERGA
jgi:hypothetical protein